MTDTSSRKVLIRQTAQQLFRARGYTATSMRQLAGKVGIEAASLYSHVRSKEEILQDICFSMAEEFFAGAKELQDATIPADQKLRQAIVMHIKVITGNLDASAVFFHDWKHLNEETVAQFKLLRDEYEAFFRYIVRQGIKENIFRDVDEKFLTLTLFSAMNWTYEWYKPGGAMQAEEIGRHIADIFLHGLNISSVSTPTINCKP